ncbi:MAG: SPASM domain-containing protein, partial [Rhodospirillaceae bacterium]|nr:SPASM domain-containing protein [Rhodospirillaceae bacterium]
VLNVFFMVCTGRGESVTNISQAVYDKVLRRVAEAARDEQQLVVRARCAPHFKRMALEMKPPLPLTLRDGYEAGGCLAGTRYCRVTPEGELTACPYMEESVGSLRSDDFLTLWRDAAQFQQLRTPALEGRCGECEYAKLCGGCRARPLARDGELMGEDFLCSYEPSGSTVIEPLLAPAAALNWTPEAEIWLKRVPAFVRRFVKRRAEDHARELHADTVTAEHMQALARRRFGAGGPPGQFARPERPGMDGGA